MDENGYRFGVGVLVLASAIIGVLLIAFFGAIPTFFVDRYQVTITFPSAPGVSQDTPVRKNGVPIGRVSRIALLDDDRGVDLTLELERKVRIRQGETPIISVGSFITGDAVVEFIPPDEDDLLERFDGAAGGVANGILDPEELAIAQTIMSDGDMLRGGRIKGDPLDALMSMQDNFAQTFTALERASLKVEALGNTIEEVIGSGRGQVRDVVDRVRTSVDSFNNTLATINRVALQVEDSRIPEAIAEAIQRLPDLIDEAKLVVTQTRTILKGFEEFSFALESIGGEFEGIGAQAKEVVLNANLALENIAKFTQPLGDQADYLIGNTGQMLENLDALLIDLRQFSRKLNQGDGTIARLIDDQQLYFEIIHTIQNVRLLTQRLQPIADDVRVFTDKISRDPGQLGVRGALQNRPIGSGIK